MGVNSWSIYTSNQTNTNSTDWTNKHYSQACQPSQLCRWRVLEYHRHHVVCSWTCSQTLLPCFLWHLLCLGLDCLFYMAGALSVTGLCFREPRSVFHGLIWNCKYGWSFLITPVWARGVLNMKMRTPLWGPNPQWQHLFPACGEVHVAQQGKLPSRQTSMNRQWGV